MSARVDMSSIYTSYSPLTATHYGLSHSLYLAAKEGNMEGLAFRHKAHSWLPMVRGAVFGGRSDVLVLIMKEKPHLKPIVCETCVQNNALDILSDIISIMGIDDLDLAMNTAAHTNNVVALRILLEHGVKGSPDLGRRLARVGRLESLKALINAKCYGKRTIETFLKEARNYQRGDTITYLESVVR